MNENTERPCSLDKNYNDGFWVTVTYNMGKPYHQKFEYLSDAMEWAEPYIWLIGNAGNGAITGVKIGIYP